MVGWADIKPKKASSSFFNQAIANASTQNTSLAWEKAAIVRILEAHHRPITLLSFSPDGKWLASADAQSLMIWEVETGKLQRILPGHHSPTKKLAIAPTSIAFSSDGRSIASSTWSQGSLIPDKSVVVWETETGKEVLSINGKQGCRQVLFSSDGKKLLSSCGLGIQVWHLSKGKQLFSFANQKPIAAFTLSPDGQTIATAESMDTATTHPIELWQLTETEAVFLTKLEGHSNEIAQLAFTNDGQKLIGSSYDGTIKLWNWQTDPQGRSLSQTSTNGLFSLSADNRWLAGNFDGGTLLNLATEQAIATDSEGKTSTVAFSSDGQILAWAGQSNTSPNPLIRFWQVDKTPDTNKSEDLARANYQPLKLEDWWGQNSTTRASPLGTDPEQIALAALGLKERVESEQQEVEVIYPETNKAVVTITQTHLADDSLFGMKYRIEFAPYGSTGNNQRWQVVWAGRQTRCRGNRGHQDWSGEPCL